jgi:1-phosphatidylinositol-4-phosphate 5-kinase
MSRSAGKGGAFFVRSARTSATLLKSLSREEAKTLAAFARPYADHMLRHPHSVLMRILGVYKAGSHTVMLIESVLDFAAAPECVFDVKGSVINRKVTRLEKGVTRLDCNWTEENRFVLLDKATCSALREQVERDALLLSEHNLMDYSLLVAFYPRDESQTSRAELAAFAKTREGRAFVSADGDCLYLMGIIDFLQLYNAKKKMAHAIKKTRHDEALLSTVAPELYASRFVQFLTSRVFDSSFVDDAIM